MLSWLATRLERTSLGQSALKDKPDLGIFKEKPTVRLVVGFVVVALSYLLGWPAVGALAVASAWLGQPLVVVVGGPVIYGFSWLLLFVGMYLLGTEGAKYGKALKLWLVRWLVEKYGSLRPDVDD